MQQPVRLVLLMLVDPREGENDFVEFSSVADAIAYGQQLNGQTKFQLEGIETVCGKSLIAYDELHDLCRTRH